MRTALVTAAAAALVSPAPRLLPQPGFNAAAEYPSAARCTRFDAAFEAAARTNGIAALPPDTAAAAATASLADTLAAFGVRDLAPMHVDTAAGTLFWGRVDVGGGAAGAVRVAVKVQPMRVRGTGAAGMSPASVAAADPGLLDAYVAARASALVASGASCGFASVLGTLVGTWDFGGGDEAAGGVQPAVAIVARAVEGETLYKYLAGVVDSGNAGAGAAVAAAVMQAAAALHQLHTSLGVVHNDVHLANFLVEPVARAAPASPAACAFQVTFEREAGAAAPVCMRVPADIRVVLMDFGRSAIVRPGSKTAGAVAADMPVLYADWDLRAPQGDLAQLAALVHVLLDRRGAAVAAAANSMPGLRALLRAALTCTHMDVGASLAQCPADGDPQCVHSNVDVLRNKAGRCPGALPLAWLTNAGLRADARAVLSRRAA